MSGELTAHRPISKLLACVNGTCNRKGKRPGGLLTRYQRLARYQPASGRPVGRGRHRQTASLKSRLPPCNPRPSIQPVLRGGRSEGWSAQGSCSRTARHGLCHPTRAHVALDQMQQADLRSGLRMAQPESVLVGTCNASEYFQIVPRSASALWPLGSGARSGPSCGPVAQSSSILMRRRLEVLPHLTLLLVIRRPRHLTLLLGVVGCLLPLLLSIVCRPSRGPLLLSRVSRLVVRRRLRRERERLHWRRGCWRWRGLVRRRPLRQRRQRRRRRRRWRRWRRCVGWCGVG